jgi:hypothetical protein
MSHIWTLVCRSTSWNSCGRNICRKLSYRAPLRIGRSRAPVEQEGSADIITICESYRVPLRIGVYQDGRADIIKISDWQSAAQWDIISEGSQKSCFLYWLHGNSRRTLFQHVLEFSGGCNSEIMFQKECPYTIFVSCVAMKEGSFSVGFAMYFTFTLYETTQKTWV